MATHKTKEGYHEGTIKAPSGKLFKITKPTVTSHHFVKSSHEKALTKVEKSKIK